MLNTEKNTVAMGVRVERAFIEWYWRGISPQQRRRDRQNFKPNVVFEHGQWWAENTATGAQWSVCDAEGAEQNGVFDGFCFERITDGDEQERR